ncbi:hypothetical protein F5B19DRAFT_480927, partial [Rostrohypoxylon terebratum]
MLTLMRIIHGRNTKIPQVITLEMYAKIAVLVDYYQCHEAVTLWSDIWITSLRTVFPKECNRDLVLWILIASVFQEGELFEMATRIAVNYCETDLPTMNLPIGKVADHINSRRQVRIGEIFDCLFSLRVLSGEDSIGCNFACSSMLLGSLMLQMHKNGLDSRPTPPYNGYSIVSVMKMINEFETPRWRATCRCTIPKLVQDNLGDGEKPGLKLEEVFDTSID